MNAPYCYMRLLSTICFASVASLASAAPVTPEYFGMHIHRAASETPWPSVSFGSWRLWDANVVWPHLEPSRGGWKFDMLDRYVALAKRQRVDVLLPFGLSPIWASSRPGESSSLNAGNAAEPKDLDAWRNYVRTVVQRYKGGVRNFEIWNEPNSRNFFSGDLDAMVRLTCAAYDEIKAIDPSAIVVSPSATDKERGVAWLDRFLQKGGARCIDVVGFHFYTDAHEPPEALLDLIDRARAVMRSNGIASKPLWNTESGWFIANARVPVKTRWRIWSDEIGSGYVLRALTLSAWKGVERFFWYAWDNSNFGLIEPDTKELKRSGVAYGVAAKWLTGRSVTACREESKVWVCELRAADGSTNRIVWRTDRSSTWIVPSDWGSHKVRTMAGVETDISTTEAAVEIGPIPVLIGERLPD